MPKTFPINIELNRDQLTQLPHTSMKMDIYSLKREGDSKQGNVIFSYEITW